MCDQVHAVCGSFVEVSWNFHKTSIGDGSFMEVLWKFHKTSMEVLWKFRKLPWKFHGSFTKLPRPYITIHDICDTYAYCVYDLYVGVEVL